MGQGRKRAPTMAELAEAAKLEASDETTTSRPSDRRVTRRDPDLIETDGRFVRVVDDRELTPDEAQALALRTRLVVWDPCGCGGGCGYENWTGDEVDDLTRAGSPLVRDGTFRELQEDGSSCGVLVIRNVRWGVMRG